MSTQNNTSLTKGMDRDSGRLGGSWINLKMATQSKYVEMGDGGRSEAASEVHGGLVGLGRLTGSLGGLVGQSDQQGLW